MFCSLTTASWFWTARVMAVAAGLWLLTSTAGCQSANEKPTITFFAAASTAPAIDRIAESFEAEAGIEVQSSYGASSTLATMLHQHVRADLFLSASRDWAESVTQIRPGSESIELLGNRLVVVVPREATTVPQALSDLEAPQFAKIAVADPQAVPAGIYARQALESSGYWETLQTRLVGAVDVRQALSLVEQGATDCAIVYLSDARSSKRVQVAFELTGHDRIVYPLVLLPGASAHARQLFRFLQSDQAAAIFEECGFERLMP